MSLAEKRESIAEFETHITVEIDNLETVTALQKWGKERGLKFLQIELDRGVTTSQPMLTRRGLGNFDNELNSALVIRQQLQTESFKISRIKIETPPWSIGVPQSKLEAKKLTEDNYFEHHIKLLLDPTSDKAAIGEITGKHCAHLSRNALKNREDNYREIFVTQRCKYVDRLEAKQRLQCLIEELEPLGYPIIKIEEEFVVYDSNLSVDRGWIL